MDTPDITRLRAVFKYHDWGHGHIEWLVGPRSGEIAGSEYPVSNGGKELRIRLDGQSLLAGKVAWALVHGWWPDFRLRFKDRDRTNIRVDNLELTARREGPGR